MYYNVTVKKCAFLRILILVIYKKTNKTLNKISNVRKRERLIFYKKLIKQNDNNTIIACKK